MEIKSMLAPVIYIPHGGGPLPLLGDPGHQSLIRFLKNYPTKISRPEAILVINAHWEEEAATIQANSNPGMFYDYYGFPQESYEIKYPAPAALELAEEISKLLKNAEINYKQDSERGYDHGLFVPLKLMYPDADIPCLQLSLLKNLDPESHINLGEALSELRNRNILVVGSGLSFHNMRALFSFSKESQNQAMQFNSWLINMFRDENQSYENKKEALINWKNAPGALFCHPREEHLLPLHVCFGLCKENSEQCNIEYKDDFMGYPVCAISWN